MVYNDAFQTLAPFFSKLFGFFVVYPDCFGYTWLLLFLFNQNVSRAFLGLHEDSRCTLYSKDDFFPTFLNLRVL